MFAAGEELLSVHIQSESAAGLPHLSNSTVALNLAERPDASRLVADWLALLPHSRKVLGLYSGLLSVQRKHAFVDAGA